MSPRKRNKKRPATPDAVSALGGDELSTAGRRERLSAWCDCGGAIVVFAAALVVFVMTLAPTVTAEDSGELIAAAWTWGVPHPPGYPLWTILCAAFLRLVPFGSVAWQANLLSAVCTAGAAALGFAALRVLRLSRLASGGAALAVVLSRWSWSQAVITEVYALNSLLTMALVWTALNWYRTRETRWLIVASLLLGLGMSNHHAVAFVGLALIVWILILSPKLLLRGRLVAASLAMFVLGSLPYVYLPLSAMNQPRMNWGDPSTLSRFWAHVSRQQYGALGPLQTPEPRSLSRLFAQSQFAFAAVVDDLTIVLACAAVVGFVIMLWRKQSVALLFVLWVLSTCLLFSGLANFDINHTARWAMRVFYIPASLGMFLPLAYLLDAVVRILLRTDAHARPVSDDGSDAVVEKASAQSRLVSPAAAVLVTLLALLPAGWLVWSHYKQCNYRHYYYAEDHARNLFACMQHNAMFFGSGDHNTFPLVYLQVVEGVRPDVMLADDYGYIRPELLVDRPENDPDPPRAWLIKHAHRPVYSTMKTAPPVAYAFWVQAGLSYHLLPENKSFDGDGLLDKCSYRNHNQPTVIDFGAKHIEAEFAFFVGLDHLRHRRLDAAVAMFERAADFGEGVKELLNNIGSALGEYGHTAKAEPYFKQAAALDRHYALPRRNLFRIAAGRHDWEEAKRWLEESIAANPRDYRSYSELGFMLVDHLNDPAGARRYWQESLRLWPDQPRVKTALTRLENLP